MTREDRATDQQQSEAEERRTREAALDKTIEDTFPASDPLSTDPNPDATDAFDESDDNDAPSQD
jgi:hypothetical protein